MAGVTGLNEVLANLNREIGQISKRSIDGLMEAGLQVQAQSQRLVPVDTANLKGSAYTRKQGQGVEVGYTAAYAPFVHEDLEARHTVGQAKYLEESLEIVDIVGIVQKRARIR